MMPELPIGGRFRHSFCMNNEQNKQIETIQSSSYKAAIVVSGGGSGAVHSLLAHPGASRFILEAQIPYIFEVLADYLGETPEQACSEKTARLMATRAFDRAFRFAPHSSRTIGISCTAALQTTRARKGEDRAFIGLKIERKESVYPIKFNGGTRATQEEYLSAELLKIVANFLGEKQV